MSSRYPSWLQRTRTHVWRFRYRAAPFRRLAAAAVSVDASGRWPEIRWRAEVASDADVADVGDVLETASGVCVPYDVQMPARSRVRSLVRLAMDVPSTSAVEFAIRITMTAGAVSERRLVVRGGEAWQTLEVTAPQAGAARVELCSRPVDAAAGVDVRAWWGDPGFYAPRPWRATVSAIGRQAAAWRRVFNHPADGRDDAHAYRAWLRRHRRSRRALRAEAAWARLQSRRFSVISRAPTAGGTVVTTGAPVAADWSRSFASLREQSYPHWEWIVIHTVGEPAAVTRLPAERLRLVAVEPGTSLAEAWNLALAAATGDFALLLDPGDTLAPELLYECARAFDDPDIGLVYGDEDRANDSGDFFHPIFKPGWSPDRLLSINYVGRPCVWRLGTLRGLGGFRSAHAGAEEWDLVLRYAGSRQSAARIPRCLYHRFIADVPPAEAARAAVVEHCQATGLLATVTGPAGGFRVEWPLPATPLVSIIIPNRDAAAVLSRCLDGVRTATAYPRREVIIVDNQTTEPAARALYTDLEASGHGRIVRFDRPFNFSAACNAGAAAAGGDLLLFLNNDVEIIAPDWLDELVRWALRPEIGIVGGRLLYPDRTIQHAGVVVGLGLVGHLFAREAVAVDSIFGDAMSYRDVTAVTGACQMLRRRVYTELGGYDEQYRVSFSDVALCLDAWKAGYRVVYNPFACLIHHESYTRQRDDTPQDTRRLADRLRRDHLEADPFFHPELNPRSPRPVVRPRHEPTSAAVVREVVAQILDQDMGAR